jgi:hypothetical protein
MNELAIERKIAVESRRTELARRRYASALIRLAELVMQRDPHERRRWPVKLKRPSARHGGSEVFTVEDLL